ncbi:uncharacterized protein LOC135638361 [Musa acuminata AAA Group]|uniref:uncharacterized protein LOC135638361 n=1 Tax=Musa acuminata AAA Group TaxID=214697 RepID=UPI0031DD8E5C
MNWTILEGLKKRVTGVLRAWVDELPSVLWTLRMTPKSVLEESPFSLAFGIEAILLPKMVFPTLCIITFKQNNSEEDLRANLDLREERRAEAHLRNLAYKKATARLYNRRVCP